MSESDNPQTGSGPFPMPRAMSVDTKELHKCALEIQHAQPALAKVICIAAEELEELRKSLAKIDAIRNDIVGRQLIHWSEHIYPLVAALHEAGYEGAGYDKAKEAALTTWDALAAERAAHEATKRELVAVKKRLVGLERTLDEAFNSGDGSYRP